MSTEKIKIIDRVKKLLALAESDNEHEAALAASMAQDLMMQHRLELAQIQANVEVAPEILEKMVCKYPRLVWKKRLAQAVADSCDLGVFVRGRRSRQLMFVGTSSGVELAEFLFVYLKRIVARLGRDYLEELDGNRKISGRSEQLHSFNAGMVAGIREVLMKEKAKREGLVRETDSPVATRAMVLISREKKAIAEFMANLGLKKGRRVRENYDNFSFEIGKSTGASLRIVNAMRSGPAPSGAKQLTD
jgi:Protein of unknown function (DUF2786)